MGRRAWLCVCDVCFAKITKFEREITARVNFDHPFLFPELEREQKKMRAKLSQKSEVERRKYERYVRLFRTDLKKAGLGRLREIHEELLELKQKIERRELLVTRIFYDCKKERKGAGYRISSESYRSRQKMAANFRGTGTEEVKMILKVIGVMDHINALYQCFKRQDYAREVLEIKSKLRL